jgi:hypothetical protein
MEKDKVTSRLLRVGYKLLDGPKTIHSSGGKSYLESMVSIRWHSETFGEWRSVRIYCDANGNDEDGYLEPMVRFATWDRAKDIFVLRPSWPNVLIELATLPIDSLELQAAVHKLQEAVGQVPFVAHGLPTRRNFGEYSGGDRGHLTVQVSSGWQELERAVHVAEVPALYETASILEAELRRLATPVERQLWLERYDRSIDEMLGSDGWYWSGQPESV